MKKMNPHASDPSIDRNIPENVKRLISQEQYDRIVDIALDFFKTKGDRKVILQNGLLSVTGTDNRILEENYYMESLVRYLKTGNVLKWKPMVFKFLGHQFNVAAYDYFMDDYENACQYLKILVKNERHVSKMMKENMIYTQHFPGTLSFLVFNYNQQFVFLDSRQIKNWGKSKTELMEQALYNLSKEEVYISYAEFESGATRGKIHNIGSPKYSAARMIELEKNLPEVIGEGGTVFIIPCNEMAFATPLNDRENFLDILRYMMRFAKNVYDNEPSPITFDVFHYYDGEVTSFFDKLKEEMPAYYDLIKHRL